MKTKFPLASALALAFALSACQQETPKSTAAPASDTPSTSAVSSADFFLYATNVDNLRLREQPNQSAKVIGQLKEGDIVQGNGKPSPNEDEVTLRNISIKAPYLQVASAPTGQPAGWAFGGALTCVYAGNSAGAPDPQRLRQFAQFLKTLNTKTLESGGKAWSYVEHNLADAKGSLADATFILLEQFLNRMEAEGEYYKITEEEHWTDEEMQAVMLGKFDPNSRASTKALVANGFRMVAAEGSVFPTADWHRFQAWFGPKATAGMKAYIDQETKEQFEPMYDDGGVIIPLEKVADLAIFWENFNKANPDFPLKDRTQQSQQWLSLILVNGSDNTPVFNGENDGINEEFKKMWAYVLKTYPQSDVARKVKQMADLCAAEQWKRTKKVEDLQAQMAK